MNLDEINKKLKELRGKVADSKEEAEVRGFGEEITKLEEERDKLISQNMEELSELKKQVKEYEEEQRSTQVQNDGSFNPLNSFKKKEERKMEDELTKENVLRSKEYRSAWAKSLMFRSDYTEAEKRALNVALTTTSDTYVAPTADADGINNGGLFIPESVSLELIKELELESPFLADVAKSFIPGLLKMPYKKYSSGSKFVKEGEENDDTSIEWGELSLSIKELSTTIRVTWKLEKTSVEEFITYLIREIVTDLKEKLSVSLHYGTGEDDVTGSTIDAIEVTYDGTTVSALDAIGTALNKLPAKKKIGANIYIASSVENEILFQKDKNGTYQNSPLLFSGLKNIGSNPVKVDPFLKDGDFIIGNPTNYKLNFIEDFSVSKDSYGKKRVNDYTGYAVVGGAPVPNSFVYGKKGA